LGVPQLSKSGHVAFTASVQGGSASSGIFLWTDSVAKVVAIGDVAPDGGQFTSFGCQIAINDNDDIAFEGYVGPSSPALYMYQPAVGISRVVSIGDETPLGGTISGNFTCTDWGLGNGRLNPGLDINNADQIMFGAPIANGSATGALFVWSAGSISTVAAIGQAKPGGGSFSSISANWGGNALTNDGTVVFTEGTTVSEIAVYEWSGGQPSKVVGSGDSLPGGNSVTGICGYGLSKSGPGVKLAVVVNPTALAVYKIESGLTSTVVAPGATLPNGEPFDIGYGAEDCFRAPQINSSGHVAFRGSWELPYPDPGGKLYFSAGDQITLLTPLGGTNGPVMNDTDQIAYLSSYGGIRLVTKPATPSPSPTPSASPTPSPTQPTSADRKVIFMDGIVSESVNPSCELQTRGILNTNGQNVVQWMVDAISSSHDAQVRAPALSNASNFLYLSYKGTYCKDSTGADDYGRPVYGKTDTCFGASVAANNLNDMIQTVIHNEPGTTFDLVGHSLGGVVAALWIKQHPDTVHLINSVTTFDSPLRGVPYAVLDECDVGSQSWQDLLCGDYTHADDRSQCTSTIVSQISGVGSIVPFYTIDATQKEDLPYLPIHVPQPFIEAVPADRTTLLSSNSRAHCQFDDNHGSVWNNSQLGGSNLIACWDNFSWSSNHATPTLGWGTPNTKTQFLVCAVTAASGQSCLAGLGAPVVPNAKIGTLTPAGSIVVPIDGLSGLSVGDFIRLNPGMPNEEQKQIAGFDSIRLTDPLEFDHQAGEPIVKVASGSVPSPGTSTPSPSPSLGVGTTTPTPTPGKSAKPGDVNCDGEVNSTDVFVELSWSAGLPVTAECLSNGDLNCDGVVDVRDVVLLLRYLALVPDAGLQTCS
jgi:pimeloyl-ACP methyl ester carboxylesterase